LIVFEELVELGSGFLWSTQLGFDRSYLVQERRRNPLLHPLVRRRSWRNIADIL